MQSILRRVLSVLFVLSVLPLRAETIRTDLLIVGGNESGVAAAIQAARLGAKDIVLTNDIEWLGGQFSAEAVGAIDEWTIYRGKRTHFPRSGLFLEVIREMQKHNARKYGIASPGNAFCASETIEPAAAARVFEEMLAPYTEKGSGQIRVLRPWQPRKVVVTDGKVTAVEFERPDDANQTLTVEANLTADSSDWGDVIRLSGAASSAGVDLKSRYGEPSAPEKADGDAANEMNPISYCVVVRESDADTLIPQPMHYHAENFASIKPSHLFIDNAGIDGIYSMSNWSIYTHRRLIDQRHNVLAPGTECVLLNWPQQDYPIYNFPKHVADALEAAEPGASRKNIVRMSYAQRRIVFEDARQHSLGFLHHLQTVMTASVFRRMKLTDEFGTADQLPPKPYVREGLRLDALYVVKEQDIRTPSDSPRWAKFMPADGVFGWQFNIDFHPTRREFIKGGDTSGPWRFIHTKNRNWSTHTDRTMLPLRALVPEKMDGLLGCSKNIGITSVVQSALRLHGQMMHCGQAVGTVAALCLRDDVQPRDIAASPAKVRETQMILARGAAGGPGVLLWPYHDLPPDDPNFVAINMLSVQGIIVPDADSLDFQPWKEVTVTEMENTVLRAAGKKLPDSQPPANATIATWSSLHNMATKHGIKLSDGLIKQGTLKLTRAEVARQIWAAKNNPSF